MVTLEEIAMHPDVNDARLAQLLVHSLGLDHGVPTAVPNIERGSRRAGELLASITTHFPDANTRKTVLQITPFVHSYLGETIFDQALQIAAARARVYPDEQEVLDEVFTAAALVRADRRVQFLDIVGRASSISDDIFGLASIINGVDSNVSFSTPDEFPSAFGTSHPLQAAELAHSFLELGFLNPGTGFTNAYHVTLQKMGNFDFLVKEPSPEHCLVVSAMPKVLGGARLNAKVELTPEYDARPHNTGEYPAIVLINTPVPLVQVQQLYRRATILYFSTDRAQAKTLGRALGEENNVYLIDGSANLGAVLKEHLQFALERRKETIDVKKMLAAEVRRAEKLARDGNEHFYDIRERFQRLGRQPMIDEMVARERIRLPFRTDYRTVGLLTPHEAKVLPYFDARAYDTTVQVHVNDAIPPVEQNGVPFLVVVNTPLAKPAVLERFPSATLLYFARDDKEERALHEANRGENIFVVNARHLGRDEYNVGRTIESMFFQPIRDARKKGVVDMVDIVQGISTQMKRQRDDILFAPSLPSLYDAAAIYWRLQESYKSLPLVAQLTDGVLMEACPKGGCFELKQPERGGCCGGGNIPDVLISFAVAYRKKVGEDTFQDELKTHHDRKEKTPWYVGHRLYERHFPMKAARRQDTEEFTF